MVKVLIGNIFDSKADVLVNTINCVGVMGKGIAKEFKSKYPTMYEEYRIKCDANEIETGKLYPYFENGKIRILNFPTKQHWRSPSRISYVVEGLEWFIENYEKLGITTIAFPPLGCGNGGLNWETVGPIMVKKLINLPISIEIYAPHGTGKKLLDVNYLFSLNDFNIDQKGVCHKEVNKQWDLVLQIVKSLKKSKYSISVGRIIFQKICFVLSRYNVDLDINFEKGIYGPYSSDIKKIITILSNNNLIYEKQLGNLIQIEVSDFFKFDANNFDQKEILAMNNTFALFKGIHNSSEAEIVTTILFSFDELNKHNNGITENQLYETVYKWKKRHENFQDEYEIRDYIKYLAANSLIKIDYTKDFKEDIC